MMLASTGADPIQIGQTMGHVVGQLAENAVGLMLGLLDSA